MEPKNKYGYYTSCEETVKVDSSCLNLNLDFVSKRNTFVSHWSDFMDCFYARQISNYSTELLTVISIQFLLRLYLRNVDFLRSL